MGFAVQITAEKGENATVMQYIIYDAVHLRKGKEFPHESQLRQKVFKKWKEDNIFMTG